MSPLSPAEERFERMRRSTGLFLGPVLFALVLALPAPSLEPAAHRLSAVLALVVTWWITEALPMPVTALLGPSLCIVLGIGEAKEILAAFANPVIFIFIGSFTLAQAMMHHGLDRRIALSLLAGRWVGDSAARLILGFGAVSAFLSMWLSNTATAAMMMPIGLGILREVAALRARETGAPADPGTMRLSTALMLMTAYGASVGGIATPIGTPPNLIGIGLIREQTGVSLSFPQWMAFAVPAMLVMFAALHLLLLWMHPPDVRRLAGLADHIRERHAALGPWTRGQVNTLAAFGVAVALWVAPGILSLVRGPEAPIVQWWEDHLPEGVVAILAASLLFVLPTDWRRREVTLTWSEAASIDWGTILLFGGGIALGGLGSSTGLAAHVGEWMRTTTGLSGIAGITLAGTALAIVVSELTTNTAAAWVIIPIVIALAQQSGVDPVGPAVGACLGASFGFMLPVSTPPNAIVYGTGLVPVRKMIKTGVVFDLIGLVLIWATVMVVFG